MGTYREFVEGKRRAIFTPREKAREFLNGTIASQKRLQADPHGFSTADPQWLIDHAEHCLRYIDCAPEGANHLVAPLQGDYGVPCAERGPYTVGPGKALRDAIEARTGRSWLAVKLDQHQGVTA